MEKDLRLVKPLKRLCRAWGTAWKACAARSFSRKHNEDSMAPVAARKDTDSIIFEKNSFGVTLNSHEAGLRFSGSQGGRF
jgi:hypothetical protein